jgi:protein involved in polysaccharide export with SLBB domain
MTGYSYLSFPITTIAITQFYVILLLFCVGCGGARHMVVPESASIPFGQGATPVKFSDASMDVRSQTRPYILQVGDVIDIKFYRAAELNESVTIRPDGKISLQYVRDVQAAGLEPMDLARWLGELYAYELLDPSVTVIVREFANQRIYVDGEVRTPKEVPLRGPMTALQALSQAGGCLNTAEVKKVFLVRYNQTKEVREVKQLNLEKVNEDVLLEPLDLVYVPRRGISDANLFMEQYIYNMIPSLKNPWMFTR